MTLLVKQSNIKLLELEGKNKMEKNERLIQELEQGIKKLTECLKKTKQQQKVNRLIEEINQKIELLETVKKGELQ